MKVITKLFLYYRTDEQKKIMNPQVWFGSFVVAELITTTNAGRKQALFMDVTHCLRFFLNFVHDGVQSFLFSLVNALLHAHFVRINAFGYGYWASRIRFQ